MLSSGRQRPLHRQHPVGRGRHKNKKPHLPFPRPGGYQHISSKKSPHGKMSKCTTDAFVEQLKETFKEVRNETFDRFQFFNCKQEQNESLEKFHSRIKQKAALCNWEVLEDSLVKSIFIQGMRNPQ